MGAMHVLGRGDLMQRLRLATGLVLFAFAATHFFNHALGLVSLDAMHAMQGWRKAVTRSWPGSILLLGAFLAHILLALYKIARRLTWRLPLWEAAQVATGISIPLYLISHVVFNRGAATLAGTDDTYAFELANIWPQFALEHAALLLCVWVHGCIGIHYCLRLTPWYPRARQVLFAFAVALPVAALAGFSVAGRQVAAEVALPGAHEELRAVSRAPDTAATSRLVALDLRLRQAFLLLLGLALLVPAVRIVRRAAAAKIEVTYRGGPTVRVAPGPTLLEISRMKGVPHASVCGGRARCSTCRVGVESGLGDLSPPAAAEAMTLAGINAPPHVRLACQIRPRNAITVTRLVAPPRRGRARAPASSEVQGTERRLAVLFLVTAFAVAGLAIDKPILSEVILTLGCVPLTDYGTPSTNELTEAMKPFVPHHNALLMANHGAVAYGEDLWQAWDRLETLEHTARIAILAKTLGGANDLPADAIEKLINIREKAGYLKANARCQACGYLHDTNITCDLDVSYPAHSGENGRKVSFTREELIELLSQAAKLG